MKLNTLQIKTHTDSRGCLSIIENNKDIPFDIKRIYYIYGVSQKNIVRGAHAHKNLQQLIISIAGSFDIIVDNGINRTTCALQKPMQALHISPMTWCELTNFSTDAVCLVLASEHYDINDYIRDYDEFLKITKAHH